jgi:chitin synthase
MYFCGSILQGDFRHMLTPCLQYIFFLPSCESRCSYANDLLMSRIIDVNVLMVYAMCNLHDDNWGTGGENDVSKDLDGVTKAHDKGESGETTGFLPASEGKLESPRDGRNIRTNVLLVWLGTNMAMITVFTTSAFFPWINNSDESTRGNGAYLAFFYPL